VDLCNFVAEAVFYNPQHLTGGANWEIGYVFRSTGDSGQFRLVVTSAGEWGLSKLQGEQETVIHGGRLDELDVGDNGSNKLDLDVSDNGSNKLKLFALDHKGFFVVNDTFVGELDLSSLTDSGDTAPVIDFESDADFDGESTAYKDFTVWALPAR
jgi:hypothetical protein